MSIKTKADLLSKGLRRQPEETKRDYAVKEINKMSKADLLDVKYRYEAALDTTLPWTWMIALYGVLFSLLLQFIGANSDIWVPCILFAVALTAGCLLCVHLYNVFSSYRYLLGYIDNRLEEMKKKK